MATTAATASNHEHPQQQLLHRPSAVEANMVMVESETPTTEGAALLQLTKTPLAAVTPEETGGDTVDTGHTNVEQQQSSTNRQMQQHEGEKIDNMEPGSSGSTTSEQQHPQQQQQQHEEEDAAAAEVRCLEGLRGELEQTLSRISSLETLESGDGAVNRTANYSSGSYPEEKVNGVLAPKTNGCSIDGGENSSSRWGAQHNSVGAEGERGEGGINSALDIDETVTTAVTASMAANREAATATAEQAEAVHTLTSSSLLQAAVLLQHRQKNNALEQESREMQELVELATQCAGPEKALLEQLLVQEEQQHQLHAENTDLAAATVKALLSAASSGSQDKKDEAATKCDFEQQVLCLHTQEQRASAAEEHAERDDGTKPQQQQQEKQMEAALKINTTKAPSMEKDKSSKPAAVLSIGSSQQPALPTTRRKETSNTSPHLVDQKKIFLPSGLTTEARPKTTPKQPAVATTAPASGRRRQTTTTTDEDDKEEDSGRRSRVKKSGAWWRQQVVNSLRLPGPNLTRRQFLNAFNHPETGADVALLNSVFDRLKVTLSPSGGADSEVVMVPHVLELLEKTNGSNIVHTLDAAELLQANVRCIERKMASQKTDLQVFATRLMCRFFLAASKKAFGELETACKRVAPRETTRTYAEELENYRQLLIKAVATEHNISFDQSTVVVSKCIHNMRLELNNDLAMLQRGPPCSEAAKTQDEKRTRELEMYRTQGVTTTLGKPLVVGGGGDGVVRTRNMTEASSSLTATAAPRKVDPASTSSRPISTTQATVLPSAYSYGAIHRVAPSPRGIIPHFPVAEYQTAPSTTYLAPAPPSHAGTAIAATTSLPLPSATGFRCVAASGAASTKEALAAPSLPPQPTGVSASRTHITNRSAEKNAGVQEKKKTSTPVVVATSSSNQAGKATEAKLSGEETVRGQQTTKGTSEEEKIVEESVEKSRAMASKKPANITTAAPPKKVVPSSASPMDVSLITKHQASQRENQFPNMHTVEYRYADGTLVTNPAHLPEGAKAIEAAARARLEETARVAQEAARRAEAAALAQFAAAAAAGGGSATAACVAAAQYKKAFAALNSTNQGPLLHERDVSKKAPEEEEFGNTTSDLKIKRVTSTPGAPTDILLRDEQQQQHRRPQEQPQALPEGQQPTWKYQHCMGSTSIGGVLRPLPAAVVAAAAAGGRVGAAAATSAATPSPPLPSPPSQSMQVSGNSVDCATAEGIASEEEGEINGARLQRVSSFLGCSTGEYSFPPTNRAATVLKDSTTATDFNNAAAGIVPPGFPPNAAGQLQALLQQQRLLTAVPPGMVRTPGANVPVPPTTTTSCAAAAAMGGGTSFIPRGRTSRPITPKGAEKERFRRRSRAGCMGSPPQRSVDRSRNSSSRTPSVSSIQRAAERFFASLGLWKSDEENGENEELDASNISDGTAASALAAMPEGIAAAAEKYINCQQHKLLKEKQQRQKEYELFCQQQLSLREQQKEHQLLLNRQQQLTQEQLLHQQRACQQQQQQLGIIIPTLPTRPPSRIPTTCEGPATDLLPKAATTVEGTAGGSGGGAGVYNMSSAAVQPQSFHQYDATEHAAAATAAAAACSRTYYTEGAAEKNGMPPVYQALYAQQQYRLAQQQRQQQQQQAEQQRQQQPQQQERKQQTQIGETWLSSQSFLLKDSPARLFGNQQQQQHTQDRRIVASPSAQQNKFNSTMGSISAKSSDDKKTTSAAAAAAEKPVSSVVSSQESEFVRTQIHADEPQQTTTRQQSYTKGSDYMEKKAIHQQLQQQAYMQQLLGKSAGGGYNPPTTRDTSVVTTHIPQQADSPNLMHTAASPPPTSTHCLIQQQFENSQAMLSSFYASAAYSALPSVPAQQQQEQQYRQHQQKSDSSSAIHPSTASSSTGGDGVGGNTVASSTNTTTPTPTTNTTGGASSAAVSGVAPQAGIVRTRVKSLSEIPSPQLGMQQIGNYSQIQAQLDNLTQRQIEAYAQQYGLYPTPQAAAAALGGVPLVGVGALGGGGEGGSLFSSPSPAAPVARYSDYTQHPTSLIHHHHPPSPSPLPQSTYVFSKS